MNIGIIFAGGVGSRMHSKELPKQFLRIHDKPIIVRTVELFDTHPQIDAIVVACVEDWMDYCKQLFDSYGINKVRAVVPGGVTGQLSIYHGLCKAKEIAGDEPAIVLLHDGVRPLIDEATISNNITSVEQFGSSVTCVPATETVVETDAQGYISVVHPRSKLHLARAPQSFWLDELLAMHERALTEGRDDFIDSASMMMEYGHPLHIIEGPVENLKVTTPGDFFSMRAILDARENRQIYGLD